MAIPSLPAHGASWDTWATGLDAAARVAVLKWQPSTAYTAGDIVINPSGQTVTANATFTSGASYSASNWTVVSGTGGGGTITDATTTAKGVVQLAGDLAGTAAAPTVPGLAAKAPTASPTFTGTVSGVTKAMVGLGNVDNTADTAKPISTATQTALNAKLDSTTAAATYVAKTDAIDLESTQDSIAGMFTGGTHSGISFSYNDPGNVINATVTPGSVADATTTAKGAVQLAGDLAGTASAPTVPGLAGKLAAASNLSDVANAATARTNLGLATVAASGAYTDLSARPTIPTVGAAGAGAAVALSSTDAAVTNARTPTAHTHPASDLTATGTRNATTFLRGDNTWATPAGGGGGGGGSSALGFPSSWPFAGVQSSTQSLNGRMYAARVYGSGTITKVRIAVSTASGNICVGVYAGGTTGPSVQPGTLKGTSGAVACPAAGTVDVALTGSVTVNEGDWFAIMADNSTAQFRAAGNGDGFTALQGLAGYVQSGGTTLPLPATLTLDNFETKVYLMIGVA